MHIALFIFFLSCIRLFSFFLVLKLLMNSKIWVLSDLPVRSVLTALRSDNESLGTTMDWMRTSPRQSRCVGIRSWGRRGSGYRWQRTRSSSSRGRRTSSPRKRSRKVRILEGCIQDYFSLVFFFSPNFTWNKFFPYFKFTRTQNVFSGTLQLLLFISPSSRFSHWWLR